MVRATRPFGKGRHYWEITFPDDSQSGYGYPSISVVAGDVALGGDVEHVIGGVHGRGWGYYTNAVQHVHAGRPIGRIVSEASDKKSTVYSSTWTRAPSRSSSMV